MKNNLIADSVERIKIADSVERIAYSKNKNIFLSFLNAKRYPLSAKRGFTLTEAMVVTGIFSALFALILSVLTNSDLTWRVGRDKLAEQQEARRAMDTIGRLLRQSNPQWSVNGTNYPAAISENNARIDFYQPIFNGTGSLTSLRKITFKRNPANPRQLLKKEGTAAEQVAANSISYLNFGGGCSGCSAFNCAVVAQDCPAVKIEVRTTKRNEFALISEITLRNQNITSSNVTIEAPQQGEF